MSPGPRRIRVACGRCNYDSVRTLKAGDDRTLDVLNRLLRCGRCGARASSGDLTVIFVSALALDGLPTQSDQTQDLSAERSMLVRAQCLSCGETGILRTTPDETLASLRQTLVCNRCGMQGAQVAHWNPREHTFGIRQFALAALVGIVIALLTIGGAYVGLKLGSDLPALLLFLVAGVLMAYGIYRLLTWLADVWEWRLATWIVGAIVIGAVLSMPIAALGQLFANAMAHEYADNVRHSPRGGYYERESQPRLLNRVDRPPDGNN